MKLSKLHRDRPSKKKKDDEDNPEDNFNLNDLTPPGTIMPDRGPDEELGDVKKMSNVPPFSA